MFQCIFYDLIRKCIKANLENTSYLIKQCNEREMDNTVDEIMKELAQKLADMMTE